MFRAITSVSTSGRRPPKMHLVCTTASESTKPYHNLCPVTSPTCKKNNRDIQHTQVACRANIASTTRVLLAALPGFGLTASGGGAIYDPRGRGEGAGKTLTVTSRAVDPRAFSVPPSPPIVALLFIADDVAASSGRLDRSCGNHAKSAGRGAANTNQISRATFSGIYFGRTCLPATFSCDGAPDTQKK